MEEKYGLTPAQYPDFAALRGDPSDNLPNIPGVGPKTATKWIVEYGSLDELLERADEVKGKAGTSLRERLEQVRMNRTLTEMIKDLELPYSPDQLGLKPVQVAGVAEKFDELEFGTNLRERVMSAVGADTTTALTEERAEVTVDQASLKDWLAQHKNQGLALFVRGRGTPATGDAEALAIADKQRHVIAVDLSDIDPQDEKALAQWLRSETPKYLHEAKATFHMLSGRGFELNGVAHDTAIAAYLLRPGQRTYD